MADDDLLPPVNSEPEPDRGEEGPVELKTRVEYSAMPKNALQSIFGLVTLEAKQQTVNTERKAMDLAPRHLWSEAKTDVLEVCVLDVSGSMSSNHKLEDLQLSAIQRSFFEFRSSKTLK